jgi:hypothetical protein
VQFSNNTHLLPAPPGLVVHLRAAADSTKSWTEPVIGFINDGQTLEPLVLSINGAVRELELVTEPVWGFHLEGAGFSDECPWADQ